MMSPSLAVVHTVPSVRRKSARAFLTAETDGSINQSGAKTFEADRHLEHLALQTATTRSIRLLETRVLPTAAAADQRGRCCSR